MEFPISIKDLFSPEFETNKTYKISTEFQITKMNKQDTKNLTQGELYTLTLSDADYSYSKFIYCKTSSSPEIEVGKYINIIRICPMILEAHKEKAFLIKELSLVKKDSLIIIKSPPYTENKNHNNNNINNQTEIENPEYTNYSQDEKAYTSLKLLTTLSKDYKLLVKVTSKGEVKPYKSGKGKLFSFVIMDELGNKMQAVAFDKIVDKFKDEIIENEIYEISGGYIRTSDKRYDPPGSDYKLILTESTTIIKKDDEEKNFKDKFTDPDNKFWSLSEIKEAPVNTIVNVVCVVGDKGETNYKDTKSGSMLIRKMFVLDQSNEKMELTLWRNLTKLNYNNGDILVCKKVRVNDFGGKNLTSITESKIFINPITTDFPEITKEIQTLKIFSDQNELNKGNNQDLKNNNNTNNENNNKKKEEIKTNIINNNINTNLIQKKEYNDKIVYIDYILDEMNKYISTDFDHRFPFYKIRATVTHLGHTEKNFYPGCPNRECNRK